MQKPPAVLPPGVCRLPGSRRRSWIEVALPAEHCRPDVLIVDDTIQNCGPRQVRRQCCWTFERGVVVLIEYFHTDIELRHRIPLGAGIGLPEAVVGTAAVAGEQSESRRRGDAPAGRRGDAAIKRRTRSTGEDQVSSGPAVIDVDVATT